MAKKCPPGKYYCFDDKKCKKIPRGYHIGARGYLARDDDNETKKNGNGSSNGNGNGGNGAGNGNGGSGSNGGGNGGGGMGEEVIYEILDKKDVPHVRKLVKKLRAGSKTHAKQADDLEVAMKEAVVTDDKGRVPSDGSNPKLSTDKMRTRSDGSRVSDSKDRKFFKTDGSRVSDSKDRKLFKSDGSRVTRTEGMYNHPEFALITVAVDELEKGLMDLEGITYDSVDKLMQGIAKRNNISPTLLHNQFKSKHLTIPDDWAIKQRMKRMRESVEDVLATPVFSSKKGRNMNSIKKIVSTPVKKSKVVEEKMTEKEKKKKEDIVKGMKKNKSGFKKRYGDDAKSVMYATATKLAMKEESKEEMLARVRAAQAKMDEKSKKKKVEGIKDKVEIKPTDKPENQFNSYELSLDDKYNVSEEGLRDWFGKSSGTTKSGRKVRGWVQVGGKYDGKPCARQPGQKSTPKCVSSSKRRSMSKSERDSAARRKRAADPNQPQKSGAAKPTNVSTDPKRKMKENYFNRNKVIEGYKGTADLSKSHPEALKKVEDKIAKHFGKPKKKKTKVDEAKVTTNYNRNTNLPIGARENPSERSAIMQNVNDKKASQTGMVTGSNHPDKTKKKVEPQPIKREKGQVMQDSYVLEAKDKKGKGSGKKDACYYKVKSRYDVWPSAYASGALVKCRKVGAKNWGNKSKNEGFSPMQVAALEVAGMIEIKEGQKCWKGYEKKGTKMMFGKRYNNCVKKKSTKEEVEFQEGSYEDFEKKSGVKAVKPKKEVELPKTPEKTPEKKSEGTFASGNPVGKKNLRKTINVTNRRTSDDVSKRDLIGKIRHVVLGDEYAPVTEGVAFLKRKKEKKNSEVERKPKKAMDAGSRLRRKKQRQEYAAKISGSEDNVPDDIRDHVELTAESKTRLVKNGHTYKVVLTWRGKTYMVQMFVPSVSRPTRQQVEKEVQKIYPDAKLMSFLPRDLEPGEPTVMMGEGKKVERDEYGDPVGGPKISKKKKKENLEKNEPDEDHTTTTAEEYVTEDDMKGMSVKSGHKRPTKSGAGMTKKGVAAYRRRNPGSKLQTAVTGKVKKGSKDAKRRKSYCARSAGQMKKFPKAAKDPNSRLRQARKRWKC